VVFILARHVPKPGAVATMPTQDAVPRPGETTRASFKPWVFAIFLLLIVVRAWAYTGITSFTPKLYANWGYTSTEYGSLLSAILLALALGGVLGGFVADWIGKRRVIGGSLALATPAFLLFFLLQGPWGVVFGIIGGCALGASQSLTLLIGQELMPSRVGLASGLVMGFTFATGSLGSLISGVVADRVGLLAVLRWIAVLPLLGAMCSIFLPVEGRPEPKATSS